MRLGIALVLVVAAAVAAAVTPAVAAPEPGSLEAQCIAAGTVLPQETQGFMFNHHPEKSANRGLATIT
jgi:hypothetical protein